jgi:hypothetical protein
MSDEYAEITIVHAGGLGRKMECPECGRLLPPDDYTECDRCGAHFELVARVHAPGVTDEA